MAGATKVTDALVISTLALAISLMFTRTWRRFDTEREEESCRSSRGRGGAHWLGVRRSRNGGIARKNLRMTLSVGHTQIRGAVRAAPWCAMGGSSNDVDQD